MHTSLTSFLTRACLASALVWSTACGDDSSTTDGSNDDTTGDAATSTTGDVATTETPDTTTGDASTSGNDTTAGPSEESGTETGSDSSGDDDTTSGSSGQESLEIGGTWIEDLGKGTVIDHIIDDASWAQNAPWGDSLFHIEDYDNEARWVVAQADESNDFDPGLYNKFTWLWQDETLYYCTAIFDAETAEEAMAARPGDEAELETGCFGFPWSVLTAAE